MPTTRSTAERAPRAKAPARRRNGASLRRDELLVIAARIFAKKGIASATVREIAEEAGILSGSLYHHFTSKEEMVREVITRGFENFYDDRDAVLDAARADPEGVMRRCIIDAVNWVAAHPDVARIVRTESRYIQETPALADNARDRQAIRLLWISIVEVGIADGVFRTDLDSDIAVRAMWDGVLATTRWFPPAAEGGPAIVGSKLADFYVGGLLPSVRRGSRRPARRTQ
jgi:TetR/AcrR family transcriptional regulator, cholesterol catabolism regulator